MGSDEASPAAPAEGDAGWFRPSRRGWLLAFAALCLIAAVACLPADVAAANWAGRAVPVRKIMWLLRILKAPGHFGFTLAVAAGLAVWHPGRWRAAGFLCLSGVASGLAYVLVKWGVGRTRPLHGVPAFELHPFRNGVAGLFRAENQSFPSGHTCLAFATAAALSLLVPRWRWAFFAGAAVVALERVLQASHYPSDVLAAAGIGVLSSVTTAWVWRSPGADPATVPAQATGGAG